LPFAAGSCFDRIGSTRSIGEQMIGSPLVGWWIAHVTFWVLLALAAKHRRWRTIGVIVTLWLAGYVVSGQIAALGLFFMPYVAALDIVLVFIVLQRDIRLT
jgi:hypothetical protein